MDGHRKDGAGTAEARGMSMAGLDAQAILKTTHQPFVVLDRDLVVQGANKAFYDTFEVEPDETEGRAIYDLGNGQWDIPKLRELLEDVLPNSGTVDDYMVEHRFETIGRRIMRINARQIPESNPDFFLLAIDDITRQEDQRKETERQKELAEITIDAAPVSFLVLGNDLKVIRANDTFYDTFGVDHTETVGRLVYQLGNDQWDIPKLRELLEEVLPDNDTFNGFEVEHDFEDIGHRVMMLNARRINHHQLILLAIDDLTEKRALEKEQGAEAARRDFILDLLDRQRGEVQPEALIEMTCEALGRHLNAAQVFYADMDEDEGHPSLPHVWHNGGTEDQIGEFRVEAFGCGFLDHLKRGQTLVIEDVQADGRKEMVGPFTASGAPGIASLADVPLVHEGRLHAILGVHFSEPRRWPPAEVKLTEEVAERLWIAIARCRAAADLRTSNERFLLVTKATNDVIWDWDISAGTLWWNENLQSVFGLDRALVEPGPDSRIDRIHPADKKRVLASFDAAIGGSASTWTEEYRFLHADGHPLIIIDRAFVIRNGEGRAVRMLGSMVDVTGERDMENRLRQAQKLEAVGQLTGGVAHDFNNLLTVILGNSVAIGDNPDDRQQVQTLAAMIGNAAERAAELTNRLLAFSRKQPLKPRLMDAGALIQGMEALLRRTLTESIDIRIVHGRGSWQTEIDPSQLDSAILNLALNARDAMPECGRLTIETVNATLDKDYAAREHDVVPGEYVMITVSDTGAGIPADVLAQVFEPFFTTKGVGEGSGLGLSMVYGFVKQSGGHIRIYSEPGEGTSVKLYFPRALGKDTDAPVPMMDNEVVGGEEMILVVEDDEMVRDYLIAQLKRLGYRVMGAASGADAVEILKQGKPFDLLFTDVVMPGEMDGRQLADFVRQTRPEMKVLFTSGYSEHAIVHNGRLDPGVELLSKPYRREQLAAKVREVLNQDRPAASGTQ